MKVTVMLGTPRSSMAARICSSTSFHFSSLFSEFARAWRSESGAVSSRLTYTVRFRVRERTINQAPSEPITLSLVRGGIGSTTGAESYGCASARVERTVSYIPGDAGFDPRAVSTLLSAGIEGRGEALEGTDRAGAGLFSGFAASAVTVSDAGGPVTSGVGEVDGVGLGGGACGAGAVACGVSDDV